MAERGENTTRRSTYDTVSNLWDKAYLGVRELRGYGTMLEGNIAQHNVLHNVLSVDGDKNANSCLYVMRGEGIETVGLETREMMMQITRRPSAGAGSQMEYRTWVANNPGPDKATLSANLKIFPGDGSADSLVINNSGRRWVGSPDREVNGANHRGYLAHVFGVMRGHIAQTKLDQTEATRQEEANQRDQYRKDFQAVHALLDGVKSDPSDTYTI